VFYWGYKNKKRYDSEHPTYAYPFLKALTRKPNKKGVCVNTPVKNGNLIIIHIYINIFNKKKPFEIIFININYPFKYLEVLNKRYTFVYLLFKTT
jgi:hypothetical protein